MTAASWVALALLGAYHGLNPSMGWLFAVSRGLQERSGAAVAWALPPIALGHALAIGLTLAVVVVGKIELGDPALRWIAAATVVAFGVAKLVRHRHPRWVGMRVGFAGLLTWSFLAAIAHGAGLMLVPLFVARVPSHVCQPPGSLAHSSATSYVGAALLHTAAMLVASSGVAFVVYFRLGLSLLRRFWFNLDRIWATALVVSGLAALFA